MIMILKKSFCFLIVSSFFLPACGMLDSPESKVVISLGERKITVDELERDLKHLTFDMGLTEEGVKQFIEPLTNKIIGNYLIIEYGKELGITVSENELRTAIRDIKREYTEEVFQDMLLHKYMDFEEWKEGLKNKLLINKILSNVTERVTPISFHEIKMYFDSHQEEFKHPPIVRFRQILSDTRVDAENIRKRLRKGENMSELAREYSVAPEAENGGEVGWVARGELEQSMQEAIFSLPVGQISPVVETPYGYHIFEVLSKLPEGIKSLPEAMAEIESKLIEKRKESFQQNWLKELRDLYPVKVNRELLLNMEIG